MIKNFIKPFMPLVLLFSVKSFASQEPMNYDEPGCQENIGSSDLDVCLRKHGKGNCCPRGSSGSGDCCPRRSSGSGDCCSRRGSSGDCCFKQSSGSNDCCKKKKCKCTTLCKLLVSRHLKARSLAVKNNAVIGGNLKVAGNATIGGFSPKLCQAEQLYNLRGNVALSASPINALTASTGTNYVYPISVTVGTPAVSTLGAGFTASNLTGSGFFYNNFVNEGSLAAIELVFSVNVKFAKPFSAMPTVVANLVDNVALNKMMLNTMSNSAFLMNFMTMPSNVTASGFTLNLMLLMMTPNQAVMGNPIIPTDVLPFVNSVLTNAILDFVVEGNH